MVLFLSAIIGRFLEFGLGLFLLLVLELDLDGLSGAFHVFIWVKELIPNFLGLLLRAVIGGVFIGLFSFFGLFALSLLLLLILKLHLDGLSSSLHVFVRIEELITYFLFSLLASIILLWLLLSLLLTVLPLGLDGLSGVVHVLVWVHEFISDFLIFLLVPIVALLNRCHVFDLSPRILSTLLILI